jgi:type IX secretion system PorP/SprF family membrane protein
MKAVKSIVTGLASVCIALTGIVKAQDIHFSQFTQSPLTVNPGLAGTTVWVRAGMNYRTQWRAVTVPYNTLGASFDIKTKRRWIKATNQTERYRQSGDNGFGWGVNIYNDRAGDGHMGTLQANGSLAYQIMMSGKNMLALGFQGGIMQRSINFNKLYWGTQYDPNSSTGYNTALPPDKGVALGDNSFIIPDLGTGIIFTHKKNERYMRGNDQFDLTLGAALFHVLQPKYSFLGSSEKLYQRMVIHGQAVIGIKNTSLAIVPAALIQRQGPNQEIFMGSLVRYMLREDSKYTGFVKGASISAGGYYRNKDAFVGAALFEFSSYAVGVSYDFNLFSGLRTVSSGRGGLEITLRFLNPAPFLFSQASFNK